MDTMDIQNVFNDPNDDKLFFNAKSSDDEVVSATIFQNSQLIIREGHAGKAKITLIANDAHRTTATDTLEVTIIKNVPDNQPPMVVNPLENKTLQAGFGTDTMDIQHVFNDPNDDVLTFNAHSSDDSVLSITILQNNQLVIREGKVGKSKITLTANDVQGATATDTLEVTIIKNIPENQPPMVVNPLENKTLQAGFDTDTMDIQHVFNDPNDDTLTFNAHSSDDSVISVTIFQDNQLVIREGKVGKSKITLTANDVQGATATDTLEVSIIENIPENQPPMVVNPLENRTLQEGFGTDIIDIQNVFNDPNDDVLTFNVHSSNDEVVSVTILQNNQLVISEVGVGISTITLTADDGQGATASTTFEVTIIGRESLPLNDAIYGTWKLVEVWTLNNLGLGWWNVSGENQYVLTMRANGTFSSSEYSYCTEGTFSLKKEILRGQTVPIILFSYNCGVPCGGNGTCVNIFSIEEGYLIMAPTSFCPEGCGGKFKKISEQQVFTENATIHYDPTGIDNCVYVIDTDNKESFTIDELDDDFNEDNLRVKISYKVTEEELNCGFGGYLPKIEIITIKKI